MSETQPRDLSFVSQTFEDYAGSDSDATVDGTPTPFTTVGTIIRDMNLLYATVQAKLKKKSPEEQLEIARSDSDLKKYVEYYEEAEAICQGLPDGDEAKQAWNKFKIDHPGIVR